MIDPSFAAILRSDYTIRRFFAVYGSVLIAVVIILALTTTSFDSSSNIRAIIISFLGNFSAAIAIFILTYGFYVFITPSGLRNAELLPLRSGEIASKIVDLREGASDYWFWGRSGTYFRSTVLPRLNELAAITRRHINVRIVVPDPCREENAARYAAMIRNLGEQADERTLPANVIATVVMAVRAAMHNPYLHVQIGLSATVPVLRFDMSNAGGLLTRDARDLPAILINAGNPYFEMLRDAVENELAQSRRVTWDTASPAFRQQNEATVEETLSAITGLPAADRILCEAAEQLLASKSHRYA